MKLYEKLFGMIGFKKCPKCQTYLFVTDGEPCPYCVYMGMRGRYIEDHDNANIAGEKNDEHYTDSVFHV